MVTEAKYRFILTPIGRKTKVAAPDIDNQVINTNDVTTGEKFEPNFPKIASNKFAEYRPFHVIYQYQAERKIPSLISSAAEQ